MTANVRARPASHGLGGSDYSLDALITSQLLITGRLNLIVIRYILTERCTGDNRGVERINDAFFAETLFIANTYEASR